MPHKSASPSGESRAGGLFKDNDDMRGGTCGFYIARQPRPVNIALRTASNWQVRDDYWS